VDNAANNKNYDMKNRKILRKIINIYNINKNNLIKKRFLPNNNINNNIKYHFYVNYVKILSETNRGV